MCVTMCINMCIVMCIDVCSYTFIEMLLNIHIFVSLQGMTELEENTQEETEGPFRHIEESITRNERTIQSNHTLYVQNSSLEANNGLSKINSKFDLSPNLKISYSKSVNNKQELGPVNDIAVSTSIDDDDESKI